MNVDDLKDAARKAIEDEHEIGAMAATVERLLAYIAVLEVRAGGGFCQHDTADPEDIRAGLAALAVLRDLGVELNPGDWDPRSYGAGGVEAWEGEPLVRLRRADTGEALPADTGWLRCPFCKGAGGTFPSRQLPWLTCGRCGGRGHVPAAGGGS